MCEMEEHIKSVQDSIHLLVASHIWAVPWTGERGSSL